MASNLRLESFAKALSGARILYFALIVGIVVFSALALVLEIEVENPPPNVVLFPVAAGLSLFFSIPAAALSRKLTATAIAQAGDAQEALGTYLKFKVVAAALVEGPALLWAVLVLLTAERWCLAGTGVGLLLLAWIFPSADELETLLGRSESEVDAELAAPGAGSD